MTENNVKALHNAGFKVAYHDDAEKVWIELTYTNDAGQSAWPARLNRNGNTIVVYTDTNSKIGIVHRHRFGLVMDAICRYFNTGGNKHELLDTIEEFFSPLMPSTGWQLWSTSIGEHIYEGEGGTEYARIIENEFTESLTAQELIELRTGARNLFVEPNTVDTTDL